MWFHAAVALSTLPKKETERLWLEHPKNRRS